MAAPPTTWTKHVPSFRTAGDIFVEGPLRFKKDSLNFYVAMRGIVGGLIPAKDTANFYNLAGSTELGSFLVGKTVDNFVEVIPR